MFFLPPRRMQVLPALSVSASRLRERWFVTPQPSVGDDLLDMDRLETLRLTTDKRSVSTGSAILLVPTIYFSIADSELASGDPSWLSARLAIRLVLLVTLGVALWNVSRVQSRIAYERFVVGITVVCASCIVALNALRPADAGVPLRTPLLWVAALYVLFPNRLRLQLIAPLLITLGIAALPGFGAETPQAIAGNVIVLLTMNAVGIALIKRRQDLTASETVWGRETSERLAAEAIARELKILRGIIPICSHCKKVRTEAGAWQQVESYVRQHSDASFSHGICPNCLSEHYDHL